MGSWWGLSFPLGTQEGEVGVGFIRAWFPRRGMLWAYLGTPGPTLVLLLTLLIPESGPDFVLPPALSSAPSDLFSDSAS